MRIVDLAQEAEVSEPTVVRFCRALGRNSFQAFKLELAQQLAIGRREERPEIGPTDSIDSLVQKIFDNTLSTIVEVRSKLHMGVLEQAATALADARRVEFIGYGGSHAVAMDAQHKFFRLRIAATCHADPHIQHMAALSLTREDVLVAVSQSGRSIDLIQVIGQARHAGARVIGIAPAATPVMQVCDIGLSVQDVQEDDGRSPLPSRITHMLIIDVLVTAVALKLPRSGEYLQELRATLESLKVE